MTTMLTNLTSERAELKNEIARIRLQINDCIDTHEVHCECELPNVDQLVILTEDYNLLSSIHFDLKVTKFKHKVRKFFRIK